MHPSEEVKSRAHALVTDSRTKLKSSGRKDADVDFAAMRFIRSQLHDPSYLALREWATSTDVEVLEVTRAAWKTLGADVAHQTPVEQLKTTIKEMSKLVNARRLKLLMKASTAYDPNDNIDFMVVRQLREAYAKSAEKLDKAASTDENLRKLAMASDLEVVKHARPKKK